MVVCAFVLSMRRVWGRGMGMVPRKATWEWWSYQLSESGPYHDTLTLLTWYQMACIIFLICFWELFFSKHQLLVYNSTQKSQTCGVFGSAFWDVEMQCTKETAFENWCGFFPLPSLHQAVVLACLEVHVGCFILIYSFSLRYLCLEY